MILIFFSLWKAIAAEHELKSYYIFNKVHHYFLFLPTRWYFGKVSRNASEEWLLAPDYPKGTFLVRQGEMTPGKLFVIIYTG